MQKVVVGLGELLWDMLPAGKRLGGAPANFTVMASRLGNHGVIASRLGGDPLGVEARDVLKAFPADISLLQTDPVYPTGTVGVEIREGEPHYVIHEPAAWDFMEWTPQWRALAQSADAVCFGSLAQRHPVSRATIREFVAATRPECVRVFDVNLRPPFFTADIIAESLAAATIFKLNELEVPQVLAMLDMPPPETTGEPALFDAARALLRKYPLELVAITMGGYGSLLVTRDHYQRHPGITIKIADTVGAGDAFTAALVDSYLSGASLAPASLVPASLVPASLVRMSEAANRWGAWVASQPGAMPPLDDATLAAIQEQIRAAQNSASLS